MDNSNFHYCVSISYKLHEVRDVADDSSELLMNYFKNTHFQEKEHAMTIDSTVVIYNDSEAIHSYLVHGRC